MRRTIAEQPEQIRESLDEVVTEAQELLAKMRSEGSDRYRGAVERLQRSLDDAREGLGGYSEAMLQRARVAGRNAGELVQEHPWQTAAIGLAIGALIAAALMSRR